MCSLHKSKLRSTSVVRRSEICPSNCFKSWTIQHHPLIISYDLVCVIQNTRLLSMILEQGLVYAIIEETWPTLRLADICSVGKSGIWCNIPASSVKVYVFVSWLGYIISYFIYQCMYRQQSWPAVSCALIRSCQSFSSGPPLLAACDSKYGWRCSGRNGQSGMTVAQVPVSSTSILHLQNAQHFLWVIHRTIFQ